MTKIPPKAFQVSAIKNWLGQQDLGWREYDIEAEVDSAVSLEENWQEFKDRHSIQTGGFKSIFTVMEEQAEFGAQSLVDECIRAEDPVICKDACVQTDDPDCCDIAEEKEEDFSSTIIEVIEKEEQKKAKEKTIEPDTKIRERSGKRKKRTKGVKKPIKSGGLRQQTLKGKKLTPKQLLHLNDYDYVNVVHKGEQKRITKSKVKGELIL